MPPLPHPVNVSPFPAGSTRPGEGDCPCPFCRRRRTTNGQPGGGHALTPPWLSVLRPFPLTRTERACRGPWHAGKAKRPASDAGRPVSQTRGPKRGVTHA